MLVQAVAAVMHVNQSERKRNHVNLGASGVHAGGMLKWEQVLN